MNRGRPNPRKSSPGSRFSQGGGSSRPRPGSQRQPESTVRAAGHVATHLAREYWDALGDPFGKRLTDILREHPEELGLLNDFQKLKLRGYLEGLARWYGWLKGHSQRVLDWPLLLAALLESDRIDDTHRNWAARCDLSPERLIALGDAPNWAIRGEGYRRVVGSQKANVDPWSLLPGWIRNHLPEVPVDEQSKVWHSEILEGFQCRPHQWVRVRNLGKHKTIEDNIEKISEMTGQQPWRARKMEASVRWPRHVQMPRPSEPWPWMIEDFSDQAVAHVCDPDPGERWCVVEPEKIAVIIDLADRMKGKGLVVVASANDRLLKAAAIQARRCGCHNVTTRAMTGDVIPGKAGTYDGVLVHDSGMAMNRWRSDPERRLWSNEKDLPATVNRIEARLMATVKALKNGGRLVYAVGSLSKDETDMIADRLGRQAPNLVPQEFTDPRTGVLGSPRLHMWPDRDWGEAIFIARWTKTAGTTTGATTSTTTGKKSGKTTSTTTETSTGTDKPET